MNNVDARLKLVLNKPEFCLINIDKDKYNIEIDNAVFYAHKVTVSPQSFWLMQKVQMKRFPSTMSYALNAEHIASEKADKK